MSASKAAATAAGRVLLKAGSRSLPAAVRGAGGGRGSKVARGLASVSLNQQSSHHRGAAQGAMLGVAACAAAVGLAALLESEGLEGMLPASLLEKLQQQGSPKALARIEEVSHITKKKKKKSTW